MTNVELRRILRITTDAFDSELEDLKTAGIHDLKLTGIVFDDEDDPLIKRALFTYVKMNFGSLDPTVMQKLKDSYDEQKKQLLTAHDKYREG